MQIITGTIYDAMTTNMEYACSLGNTIILFNTHIEFYSF